MIMLMMSESNLLSGRVTTPSKLWTRTLCWVPMMASPSHPCVCLGIACDASVVVALTDAARYASTKKLCKASITTVIAIAIISIVTAIPLHEEVVQIHCMQIRRHVCLRSVGLSRCHRPPGRDHTSDLKLISRERSLCRAHVLCWQRAKKRMKEMTERTRKTKVVVRARTRWMRRRKAARGKVKFQSIRAISMGDDRHFPTEEIGAGGGDGSKARGFTAVHCLGRACA